MLLILPIIVIAGASVILLCYIMYMLRNKIPCYSYNKMKTGVAIKLKTIRSSNSNVSNKQSQDSESEWEDFCSSIEDKDKEEEENKDENKDNLSADRRSNTDSLTWDNETNIVGVSAEHIYDLVYEGPVPANKEIEVELEPPQDAEKIESPEDTDAEKIESPEEKKPITEHVYMNFHPSNPFIDYKAIERSASNPFLLETTNNISANPFRRAYSEDNLDNKPEDDRIDASAVSLV
ncbi:IEV transmembrane phosphoprotein [Murmansk poxvirus]|uniref:IEV transmembrane phosphoprotein n=1 Tax=Murmansk poxvirus TaxID=2025359 RepID=A0A223FMY7_9POXV|nr:IEV transmembrane phosphoprotein [Murmansk poxvirus]AST09348.1 IEV transmembrane phosphoprotein [Murmansk poxvirus]